MIQLNNIEVRESKGKGRGVFATKEIKKGEIIEVAPAIFLEFSDFFGTSFNKLFNYYFWLDDYVVLALGYGSIYNHSEKNNAEYEINKDEETVTFRAVRNIKPGEEILFNYRGKAKGDTPLWFESSGDFS